LDLPIESLIYFISAFLSTALLSVAQRSFEEIDELRARRLVDDGRMGFKDFAQNPQSYLLSLELLRTLSISGLFYFGYTSLSAFSLHPIAIFCVIPLALLLSNESIKHLFASLDERKVAEVSIKLLKLFTKILRPITFPLEKFFQLFVRGNKHSEYADADRIGEELELMIDESQKQGGLEKLTGRIMQSAIDFGETIVREIMVPRTDIVACSVDYSIDAAFKLCAEEGYSRLPVYEGSLDEIVGILYFKDIMLRIYEWDSAGVRLRDRQNYPLKEIIREAYFVPETNHINELLQDFQREHIHMAIAIDEFGGTAGIVTLEDLMEEFFGEIQDEYDSEDLAIVPLSAEDHVLVDAKTKISDINEHFDVDISEDEDFDTIGGYVTYLLGRVGNEGDSICTEELDFTVRQANERCILQLEIARCENPEDAESHENSVIRGGVRGES
jgi:CBS domain containing-hemolysin-like protein